MTRTEKVIRRLKWIWKRLQNKYRYYDVPILVAPKKGVWVWYDPDSNRSGVATKLAELKKFLRERFYCPQCQSWHVYTVIIDYGGGVVEIEDFYQWVRTWELAANS